jgi:hypothetical protein
VKDGLIVAGDAVSGSSIVVNAVVLIRLPV